MIRLRPLEKEDLPQLRDWRNEPEIFERVREYRFLNMQNQESWFAFLRDDRSTIMFGIEEGGKLIGACGLTHIDWVCRRAEISLYIGCREMRGRGIGLTVLNHLGHYAFHECNLQRLWAEVFEKNEAGQHLFKKAGYVQEGRLRKHVFKQGARQDAILYGLLREEWQPGGVLVEPPAGG